MRFLLCLLIFSFFISFADENFRTRKHVERWYKVTDEDIRAEVLLGREVAAKILGKYDLVDDEALQIYVNKVGKYLALYSGRGELDFKFGVVNSEEINAYSTPGGYVFVTLGAIKRMRNEAELAGVLAHEIGHVAHMHVIKDLDFKGKGMPSSSIIMILSAGTQTISVTFSELIDKATDILFERGFRKEEEFEADETGVIIMAMAGYDPEAYVEFLKRTKYESVTHPNNKERVERLMHVIEKLKVQGGKRMEERFVKNVKGF